MNALTKSLLSLSRFAACFACATTVSACKKEEVIRVQVPKETPFIGAPPAGMGMGQPGMDQPAMSQNMPSNLPPPPEANAEDGLRWSLPAGWGQVQEGGMRYATLTPPKRPEGDAEVTVITLAGQAGGELANVNRWRGQIGLGPVAATDEGGQRTVVASKAGDVSVYDMTGQGEAPKRLLVGLLTGPNGNSWFIKLTGTGPSVEANKADFLALLATLSFGGSAAPAPTPAPEAAPAAAPAAPAPAAAPGADAAPVPATAPAPEAAPAPAPEAAPAPAAPAPAVAPEAAPAPAVAPEAAPAAVPAPAPAPEGAK